MGIEGFWTIFQDKFLELNKNLQKNEDLQQYFKNLENKILFIDTFHLDHNLTQKDIEELNKKKLNEYIQKIQPKYLYCGNDGQISKSKYFEKVLRKIKNNISDKFDQICFQDQIGKCLYGKECNKKHDLDGYNNPDYCFETDFKEPFYIKLQQQYPEIKQIISTFQQDQPEQEHKIIQEIRELIKKNQNQNFIIVTRDNDLILLAISSRIPNLYIVREDKYHEKDKNSNMIIQKTKIQVLNIDELKKIILKNTLQSWNKDFQNSEDQKKQNQEEQKQEKQFEESNLQDEKKENIVLNTFILITLLMGNDYLPGIGHKKFKEQYNIEKQFFNSQQQQQQYKSYLDHSKKSRNDKKSKNVQLIEFFFQNKKNISDCELIDENHQINWKKFFMFFGQDSQAQQKNKANVDFISYFSGLQQIVNINFQGKFEEKQLTWSFNIDSDVPSLEDLQNYDFNEQNFLNQLKEYQIQEQQKQEQQNMKFPFTNLKQTLMFTKLSQNSSKLQLFLQYLIEKKLVKPENLYKQNHFEILENLQEYEEFDQFYENVKLQMEQESSDQFISFFQNFIIDNMRKLYNSINNTNFSQQLRDIQEKLNKVFQQQASLNNEQNQLMDQQFKDQKLKLFFQKYQTIQKSRLYESLHKFIYLIEKQDYRLLQTLIRNLIFKLQKNFLDQSTKELQAEKQMPIQQQQQVFNNKNNQQSNINQEEQKSENDDQQLKKNNNNNKEEKESLLDCVNQQYQQTSEEQKDQSKQQQQQNQQKVKKQQSDEQIENKFQNTNNGQMQKDLIAIDIKIRREFKKIMEEIQNHLKNQYQE